MEELKKHIYGPSRATEEEAQEDLEQVRKAGAVGKDREEALKIMAAEARRIQLSAQFEAEAEMQRQLAGAQEQQ